jgi:hypothetical protein
MCLLQGSIVLYDRGLNKPRSNMFYHWIMISKHKIMRFVWANSTTLGTYLFAMKIQY